MKTMKVLMTAILMFAIAGIFPACKKDHDKKSTCRLIGINIISSDASLKLYYNPDGKINKILSKNFAITYVYNGNTILLTTHSAGKFQSRRMITVNPAGLATNVREEFDLPGTKWSNTVYEYNGPELVRSTATRSIDNSSFVTTYAWSKNNMIAETSASNTTTYTYYIDKPTQIADYISFTQLTLGYETIRNKNLVKSAGNINFVYDFRPDGYISSYIGSDGNNISYSDYLYECD
jgi:hypothetical protein